MSKLFGTPAFSAKMKNAMTHVHVDPQAVDPKRAFDAAIAAPVSKRPLDIANAIHLVGFALDMHKQAMDTTPQAVVGRGRITGLTKKIEDVQAHIALGLDASDAGLDQAGSLQMEAAAVTTAIQEFNNRGVHPNTPTIGAATEPSLG